MGTIAVTGSASGIGRATRERLVADGHRVIGIDRHDADVVADLATAAGRQAMVDGVAAAGDGVLDGLVAGAGVSGAPGEVVVSVNYFGAVATLEGLRPLLAAGTDSAAVVIVSNSASTQSGPDLEVAAACAAGDEDEARSLAQPDATGIAVYPATKLALAHWTRRQAVSPEWIGSGIRLNAVAPGFIDTAMTAEIGEMVFSLGDAFPIPIGRAGRAEEVAGLIAYLLGPEAGFFVGSVVYMDGGTDAQVRSDDWPSPRPG